MQRELESQLLAVDEHLATTELSWQPTNSCHDNQPTTVMKTTYNCHDNQPTTVMTTNLYKCHDNQPTAVMTTNPATTTELSWQPTYNYNQT